MLAAQLGCLNAYSIEFQLECCMVLAGYMMNTGLPYYAGVTAAAGHYMWQLTHVDLDSRQDCLAKFVSNKWFGALLFSGIVADKLLMQTPGIA